MQRRRLRRRLRIILNLTCLSICALLAACWARSRWVHDTVARSRVDDVAAYHMTVLYSGSGVLRIRHDNHVFADPVSALVLKQKAARISYWDWQSLSPTSWSGGGFGPDARPRFDLWRRSVQQYGGVTTSTGFALPYWAAVVLVILPLALSASRVVMRSLRDVLRRRRASRGMCPACGYDLRATPPGGRCPECGTSPDREAALTAQPEPA
jgi:hypothetical protein